MEQVKKGYKKTEVGIIPEDWRLLNVSDTMDFSGGSQPPRFTFKFSPQKGYVRLIQIRDYKTDKYESYIPEELAKKTCTAEDIMIGRYGPPIFQILKGIEGAYNVALIKVLPKENILKSYAYYFLKQRKLYEFIEKLSQRSSGQTGVDLVQLKAYKIPLPPTLTEQKAIADALSDVDELIASLEKLIEKKKAIKQGAMQALLTPPHKGGKRLDGFSGEWKEAKLGEIFKIIAGKSKSNFINGFGKYLIVDMGSVSIEGKLIALKRTDYSSDFLRQGNLVMPKDDIGGGFIIGRTAYIPENDKYILGDHVFKLEPYYGNSLFYSYLINSNTVNNQIKKKVSGSAQLGLGRKSVEMQILHIPYSNEEQNAIAEVLSDMDTEIQAIELNLHKTTLLKQGMIQELLTGKTRLV